MPMEDMGPTGPTVEQDGDMVAKQEQLPAKEQAQVDAYLSGLSKMLHGDQTKAQLYEMLKSGPPEQTIPATALQVNNQMEQVFKSKGHEPNMNTLVAGAQFLVSDLIEIGNAGGFFELNPEDPEVVGPLLTNTMQPYIEKGLKDGTIDPVELQAMVEPLMSEDARAQGMAIGQEQGLTETAGVSQAMKTSNQKAVLADRKVQSAKVKQGVLG